MNECIRQLDSMIGFLTVDSVRVKTNLVKRILSEYSGLCPQGLKPPMYSFCEYLDDLIQSLFVEDITVERGGMYDEKLVDSVHFVIEQIQLHMPDAVYDVKCFFWFYGAV